MVDLYTTAALMYSYGAGQSDAWLIKTDSLGNIQWAKTYGGEDYDFVYDMAETQDHGYFITGMTQSFGNGNADAWFIRIDSLGDTLWTKTYGDTGYEYAVSGIQTADAGYIACGYKMTNWIYDLWIIKLDSLGNQMWTKLLGHSDHDYGQSIRQTPDLGYICAGDYYIAGSSDIWLIRLESESGIKDNHSKYLEDNYKYLSVTPNPFREKSTIRYTIHDSRCTTLRIYDVSGRLMKSFNPISGIGHQESELYWDGCDDSGRQLPNGIYFVELKSGNQAVTKKVIVLR